MDNFMLRIWSVVGNPDSGAAKKRSSGAKRKRKLGAMHRLEKMWMNGSLALRNA
jgi:hypothetical protein